MNGYTLGEVKRRKSGGENYWGPSPPIVTVGGHDLARPYGRKSKCSDKPPCTKIVSIVDE